MFKSKAALVGVILVLSVVADQVTKLWAEATLASPRYPDHTVEVVVGSEGDGKTLHEFLGQELTWTSTEDIALIAGAAGRPGFVTRDDVRLAPSTPVKAGDTLELGLKTATIIDGFWDHHYARNPGAAFSFMADQPELLRRTFFIVMSSLAVLLMGWFLYKAGDNQRRLQVSLALVMGGAIGNLIDRVLYGYVIDFIAWHVGESYWPTFNIADAVICVGIGLLAIEMIFGFREEKAAEDAAASAAADARANPSDPPSPQATHEEA